MSRAPTPTLTMSVADEIRRRILSGEIPPGTRLRQIEWAERLGVSPTPVREAFTTLAKAGLVRHDARRGVVVFTATIEDVLENYEIRLALEGLATELAAKQITDEQLAEIDAVLAEMGAGDGPAYPRLNRELHHLIYAAARRPQLEEMIDGLRDRFDAYIGLDVTHPNSEARVASQRQHEAIVAALRARDAKLARRLLEEHLKRNRKHIISTVENARTDTAETAS